MSNEPKRWLEDGANGFERELLASAEVDRASPRALSRTLASVQIAAAATLVATTTTAATGASASLGAVSVLKWLGIGVVSGLATMLTVESVSSHAPKERTQNALEAAAPSADRPSTKRAVLPRTTTLQPAETRAIRGPRPVSVTGPAPEAPGTPPPAGSSAEAARDLAREAALISQAARNVESGNATQALGLLDQYAREHPRGVMRPEAAVVRVRALVRAGRTSEAKDLAGQAGAEPAHARAMQRALEESSARK
jgi:hypothetical protein